MSRLSAKLRLAQGGIYIHWCPGCEGYHGIHVDTKNPLTGAQWRFNGNAEAPIFNPSINIAGQCHYFIRHGRPNDNPGEDPAISYIDFCGDSKHALAGKIVPLPDLPEQGTWL